MNKENLLPETKEEAQEDLEKKLLQEGDNSEISATTTTNTKEDSQAVIQKFTVFGKVFTIDIFLITIMINNFLLNACFSNIMPFFPQEALSKGVPEYLIGIIFATLPFGGILSSFFLAKYICKIGRKKTLLFGVTTNLFSAAVLGCLNFIDNELLFSAIAIISRLIQGFGRSAYSTATFSSISVIYPSTFQKKIGYVEAVSGLGMMLGPAMGSGLYSLGGYPAPFFTFSGVFLLMLPFTVHNLNKLRILDQASSYKQKLLRISRFLTDRRVISIFLAIIIGNINLTYLGPTFASHLISYGMEPQYIGLIYPVGTCAYIISIKFVTSLRKDFDGKILISTGLFLNIFSQSLIGPLPFILPHSLILVIVSQFFLGISLCLIFIPFIQEMKKLGSRLYPEENDSVADMASGFFSAGITIGGVIGPISGGALTSVLGFVNTTIVYTGAVTAIFLVYFSFGDGFLAIFKYFRERNRKNQEISAENDKEIDRNQFNSTVVEEIPPKK